MDKQESDWRAESDARTLTEAEDIKRDKGRLNKAKAKLRQQVKSVTTAAERVGVRLRNLKPRK